MIPQNLVAGDDYVSFYKLGLNHIFWILIKLTVEIDHLSGYNQWGNERREMITLHSMRMVKIEANLYILRVGDTFVNL